MRFLARRDKVEWVKSEVYAAQDDLQKGRSRTLLAFANRFSGKQARLPKSAAAFRGADGVVIDSPEAATSAWRSRFADEFSSHAQYVEQVVKEDGAGPTCAVKVVSRRGLTISGRKLCF